MSLAHELAGGPAMARRGDGIYQRGRIGIMLAAVFSVLGVVTSASAECAWLWWQEAEWKTPAGISQSWETPRAYPTQSACAERLASQVHTWDEKYRAEQSANFKQTASLLPGGLTAEILTVDPTNLGRGRLIVRIYCLPDTVDPRGPKGGK
jgi:hypothetical protein